MLDKTGVTQIAISAPNFQTAKIRFVGNAPYVMNKFSSLNRKKMMDKQEAGHTAKKGAKREPKNFDAIYRSSMHVSVEGWYGIPASSIRSALIDACRMVGFQMTRAKMSVFVVHDGIDADDGTPLIKLIGKPERRDIPVKLADGSTDILARPFFAKWSAVPLLRWDADQFSATDVINLAARAGTQVGIGAGRPYSKNSHGCGWGTWDVEA